MTAFKRFSAACKATPLHHPVRAWWEIRAKQGAEKRPTAANHPGAQGATPPESGGELLKTHPSSYEEGWRAERRAGAEQALRGVPKEKSSRPTGLPAEREG